ncbi:hypothetical protein [uncultured Mitsuokella sp.]|uniref:hypothetical protein n=1 Tax=uncultured Mitsuokella sp. TaxID=453120 RepID=UPI002595B689|nr:hypothetical protein [uncultured Mitsuokella sp.]
MAKYLDKWKDLFPDTVGGTTRPSEAVSDQEEFNTDGFPQFIAQDPVNYALQNAFLKQFLSNDAWLWVKQKQANQALDDHKVDTQAHAKGISGNAGSATKLKTARSINLSGAVTADAASFDGTADATINVKTLDASKLKGTTSVSTTGNAATATKLATARTIALSGNASGSATFDGSGNATINATVSESAHAATATKVVTNAASGASANIAEATMGGSDFARIRVSGANDAGELAIETADNGAEPIVARQYTGTSFKTVVRTAAILDGAGNTSFPGTVTAQKFTGALNGNAATTSKLLTPRTISLTGKAAGSTTFDGSANASINVTSVNADTASKLSTARKINITGNATGAAAFDGSGDISINTTVNESKHAASATTVNATAPNGGAADLAFGTMATNDYARIRVYGKDDNGALEIATADGGNEPIYARQYSGPHDWLNGRPGTVTNEAAILDSNGNTKFPKNVTAASFTGPLNGTATNADKLDGYHASDLFRHLGGNQTPVITDIFDRAGTIDMTTMSAADKATHKANINKASNAMQNIWNTGTGIHAYGGDYDMAGYNRGTLKLTQSYKNFDKILVVGVNDKGDLLIYKLWDVWALANAFASSSWFQLFHEGDYWFLYGSTRRGTRTDYALSTDTVWSCQEQNSGIVAIYGIKY